MRGESLRVGEERRWRRRQMCRVQGHCYLIYHPHAVVGSIVFLFDDCSLTNNHNGLTVGFVLFIYV